MAILCDLRGSSSRGFCRNCNLDEEIESLMVESLALNLRRDFWFREQTRQTLHVNCALAYNHLQHDQQLPANMIFFYKGFYSSGIYKSTAFAGSTQRLNVKTCLQDINRSPQHSRPNNAFSENPFINVPNQIPHTRITKWTNKALIIQCKRTDSRASRFKTRRRRPMISWMDVSHCRRPSSCGNDYR